MTIKSKTLRTAADLLQANLISAQQQPVVSAVAEKYAVAITPQLSQPSIT